MLLFAFQCIVRLSQAEKPSCFHLHRVLRLCVAPVVLKREALLSSSWGAGLDIPHFVGFLSWFLTPRQAQGSLSPISLNTINGQNVVQERSRHF